MADAPREIELKLELEPGKARRLAAHPLLAGGKGEAQDQSSTYFDTKKGALRKAGFTLRVRNAGDRRVQTVKAAAADGAGLFDRDEWETPVDGEVPDLAALATTPAAAALGGEGARKLKPLVRSEVCRTRWDLRLDGAAIELVLDEGVVSAGKAMQDFCEIELELKEGEPEALFAAGRALGADLPLRLGVLTKAERGFALADGTLDKVAKSEPVALAAEMSVADGFGMIVAACLRHFRRNEPLILAARDPGALHQARVAMRRLRSAFSLFGPALKDERFEALRGELRWFTEKLGDARNLDVFLARGEGDARARRTLQNARDKAYDVVVQALASKRFRLLMLDLVAWTATGDWRRRRKARGELADFARARLGRLWEKVAARGLLLRRLDEETRHRLRIDIKKLRYAVEFLASLWPDAPDRKRFAAALEAMQESLGHLNDMATARLLHAELGLAAPPADAAHEAAEEERHLAATEKAFSRLKRAGPFWHLVA